MMMFLSNNILWIRAFHVISVIAWMSGMLYLPRLFVYHTETTRGSPDSERFKIMERKRYYGIRTPGAVLTVALGVWMLVDGWEAYEHAAWMHAKLLLAAILIAYHLYCAKLLAGFKHDRNRRSHIFYRWFNELPVVILIAVVILVVVRPF